MSKGYDVHGSSVSGPGIYIDLAETNMETVLRALAELVANKEGEA